jgi:hypothetical protein
MCHLRALQGDEPNGSAPSSPIRARGALLLDVAVRVVRLVGFGKSLPAVDEVID